MSAVPLLNMVSIFKCMQPLHQPYRPEGRSGASHREKSLLDPSTGHCTTLSGALAQCDYLKSYIRLDK